MAAEGKKRGKLGIILGLVAGVGVVGVVAALLLIIVVLIGAGGAGWYYFTQMQDLDEAALIEAIDADAQQIEDQLDKPGATQDVGAQDGSEGLDAQAEPAADDEALADAALADAALAEDALAEDALAEDAPVEDDAVADAEPPAPVAPSPRRQARKPATTTAPRSSGASSSASSGTPTQIKLLSSPPNAILIVDGEDHGVTPAKFEVTSGTHQIEIRSAGETGRFTIRVSPGGNNKWCYDFDGDVSRHGSCL